MRKVSGLGRIDREQSTSKMGTDVWLFLGVCPLYSVSDYKHLLSAKSDYQLLAFFIQSFNLIEVNSTRMQLGCIAFFAVKRDYFFFNYQIEKVIYFLSKMVFKQNKS